jgi:hypothetical protein
MSDSPLNEQAPTPEELEREARRLARIRHLTVVRDGTVPAPVATLAVRHDRDPDPQAAA